MWQHHDIGYIETVLPCVVRQRDSIKRLEREKQTVLKHWRVPTELAVGPSRPIFGVKAGPFTLKLIGQRLASQNLLRFDEYLEGMDDNTAVEYMSIEELKRSIGI